MYPPEPFPPTRLGGSTADGVSIPDRYLPLKRQAQSPLAEEFRLFERLLVQVAIAPLDFGGVIAAVAVSLVGNAPPCGMAGAAPLPWFTPGLAKLVSVPEIHLLRL